jgi:hypothetical protein
MKTPALFGFISALVGFVLNLILFFAGLHSDPAKIGTAQAIGWIGFVIFVVCQVLAVRGRRSEVPATQPFGYGSALWAGTVMAAVSSVLGSVFYYCYAKFINPGLTDVLYQAQDEKLQAKGLSGPALDRAEGAIHTMLQPGIASISFVFFVFILGFLTALVVAAFIRRPEGSVPPPIQA